MEHSRGFVGRVLRRCNVVSAAARYQEAANGNKEKDHRHGNLLAGTIVRFIPVRVHLALTVSPPSCIISSGIRVHYSVMVRDLTGLHQIRASNPEYATCKRQL